MGGVQWISEIFVALKWDLERENGGNLQATDVMERWLIRNDYSTGFSFFMSIWFLYASFPPRRMLV